MHAQNNLIVTLISSLRFQVLSKRCIDVNRESKPTIVFYAAHSTSLLLECWDFLKDRAECYWVTPHPNVYAELKSVGCQNIVNEQQFDLVRAFIGKSFRKINSFLPDAHERYVRNTIQIIESVDPDIVITNTVYLLKKYIPNNPRTIKVQLFHSVPYKTHIILPEALDYDLILLPGEYHRKTFIDRFNLKDATKLQSVGWPRTDKLITQPLSDDQKKSLLKQYNLDPELQTVSYAPTWNAFYDKGLFPRSFGHLAKAFEDFCREMMKLNINLVIRLHPGSHKLIEKENLNSIARKYNVCLFYKKQITHLDNTVYDFLSITDILVSDMSGIITDFMVLNRPIIYIEPEVDSEGKKIDWDINDLPKDFRAGPVVDSMDDLISSVKQALEDPYKYKLKREETLKKIFYKLDGFSSERAANAILQYYRNFTRQ